MPLARTPATSKNGLIPEAPDIPTAWRHLLERTPGTRQGNPLAIEAAHVQPKLRGLYPWPSRGTLEFLRSAPSSAGNHDDLPFIVSGGPSYMVYTSGYTTLLGELATPEEAAALVVARLPGDSPALDE
ncbi:DUF6193 family natural product biosynthesis protein [Streptomyces varsoviensis]|uniref:DUF6193 family natural product biosynthesis protein n=1 Tax=Streptomyces varsoviensis TaxID=67373 RepID=UPI00340C11DC